MCSIPRLKSFPGRGHGNPLQYSCLENPHGQRSLVGYTVHSVTKSQTWLKRLSKHTLKIVLSYSKILLKVYVQKIKQICTLKYMIYSKTEKCRKVLEILHINIYYQCCEQKYKKKYPSMTSPFKNNDY